MRRPQATVESPFRFRFYWFSVKELKVQATIVGTHIECVCTSIYMYGNTYTHQIAELLSYGNLASKAPQQHRSCYAPIRSRKTKIATQCQLRNIAQLRTEAEELMANRGNLQDRSRTRQKSYWEAAPFLSIEESKLQHRREELSSCRRKIATLQERLRQQEAGVSKPEPPRGLDSK